MANDSILWPMTVYCQYGKLQSQLMAHHVPIYCCSPMVCVGFWAEVELDKSLANFISNTTSGDAADAYWRAEQARYVSTTLQP